MTSSRSFVDRALDFGVIPGFTSVGYRLRSKAWDATPDLTGLEVLVTGASSGLGAATCELLAEAGASVHMLVRDLSKGEDVRARISELTGNNELRLWRCDVSVQADVREFAEGFAAEIEQLDALVNNAGAMPPERSHTTDGVELSFATNVLGPFLLARCLSPRSAPARPVAW